MYPASGFYPDDPVCHHLYEKARDLGVPVLFHTANAPALLRSSLAHPMWVADVAARYPELTIIYGHAGYPAWGVDAAAVASGHVRSYLELSKWNGLLERDPETLIRMLATMRDQVGAHRILWASDYAAGPSRSGPHNEAAKWLEFFQDLPETAPKFGRRFSREEIDLMLGANAARLLRLE
jgi:predicted TIM-barrel fold metal-dependent hydrolase